MKLFLDEPAPDLARLFRPRSIAIAGVSPEPGSPGFALLGNLERFGYAGSIHLVSRRHAEIAGRRCVGTIGELPEGVDLLLLMLPRAAIEEAVAATARRRIGAAVVFAAGFAEAGGEWLAAQQRIAATARAAGIALCGPNCLGIVNYVDRVPLTFSPQPPPKPCASPALAVVAQSGGLATILRNAFWARDLAVAYTVSTGNEAVLALEDYLDYLIAAPETRVVACFAEQLRKPQRFLAAASRARDAGKPVVLLHPGRSAAARESARSHTGALAGDHAMISRLAAHAGALLVESLEELIDASELMMRFPKPPTAGLAVLTDSGAFKGMTLDLCAAEGLDLPPLPPATAARLSAELPDFVGPSNPLDVTAQGILHLDLYARTATPLLEDPTFGSLLLAVIITGAPDFALAKGRAALDPVIGKGKPTILGFLGDEAPVPEALVKEARAAGIPFFRSPERALRALARVTAFGRAAAVARERSPKPALAAPALPGTGAIPEHRAKGYLAKLGLAVPRGRLASDLADAQAIAAGLGFPVALKLQSPRLLHKSDVGGVALAIADAPRLAGAWAALEKVATAHAPEGIDGILVEAMARPGLELMVGARRDPEWGPILLAGLGGVWAEALNDVRLLPPDVDEDEIAAELRRLKGAKLLGPWRGDPPRDVAALARLIGRIGALMLARPELRELDLNPVALYAEGEGALILDALLIA